jgi:hypothetical protein
MKSSLRTQTGKHKPKFRLEALHHVDASSLNTAVRRKAHRKGTNNQGPFVNTIERSSGQQDKTFDRAVGIIIISQTINLFVVTPSHLRILT